MALPTDVDISSFDRFVATTDGRGFDIDGQHGYQCWDYGALLWGLTGHYNYPYLSTGGTGYAYGIWSARVENASDQFDLIYDVRDVKRGDLVILDRGRFALDESGHDAFACEDYNGTNTMLLIGQNQVNANPDYGHVVTSNSMSIAKFLGAFRYKAWGTPTPPTPETERENFPWVLYARKLRKT